MKKVFSKLVVLVLSLSMLLAAAAFGGETADLKSAGIEGQKIGLMIYSTTTPWAVNIIDAFENICKEVGAEAVIAEAGNPGEIMNAAENLAGAGVSGVMCMMDGSIGDKVIEFFGGKEIPVSFAWGNYIDAPYFDALASSEYYAGSVSSMDLEAAKAMTQHCIDMGADKWVFLGMPEGSGVANDNRAVGFKECLAENNIELLAEVRSYDKVEGSQNLITNYPDLNGFGAGLNAAKNAGGVLEQAGKTGANEVFMFCYEAAEDYVIEYFEAERLHGCADGCIGQMEIATAMLFNAMTGHKIVGEDGIAASLRSPYLIAYTADDYKQMHDYTYGGNLPFNMDEFAQMLVTINEEADYEMFESTASEYSIESIAARR